MFPEALHPDCFNLVFTEEIYRVKEPGSLHPLIEKRTKTHPEILSEEVETESVVALSEKAHLPILVLVSYPSGKIPGLITESFEKIFLALGRQKNDFRILNVAHENPNLFACDYLLLMGGNGKSLEILKNYSGPRNKNTSISTENTRAFFADTMEVYLNDNVQKKAFWESLKKLFADA